MVGDTPYDALAAIEAGASAIGLITGGFSRDELQQSGCRIVLDNLQSLANETLSSATH
jgi:phosphoglycolate phosphatase-like HAD superfamily hydrolase